ncbi:hypothetical protein [Endozoicomonas sp. SESOKO1]|uniref:hypothetical protein n=1 Tax=Endozoicomonas sp. SESOKO1 TaxID=2828742 RepID=UPI00214921B7|nr:hypothetical protein [Endozoicomonas sp. SESOKO1]
MKMKIYSETIQEIKALVEQHEIRDKQDIEQYLDRCSELDPVAEGIYATVYNLPDEPDKVVKVCPDKKDGYYLFARWCMTPENQSNPHLPVIHREDVITLPCGIVVRIYVVERLSDFMDDGSRATQPRHFHDYDFGLLWGACKAVMQSFGVDNSGFNGEIKTLEVFVEKIKVSSSNLVKRTDNDISDVVDSSIIESHDDFLQTLFDVLTQLSTVGSMDLHGGNFMLRGDTVVITDPIAHKYAA